MALPLPREVGGVVWRLRRPQKWTCREGLGSFYGKAVKLILNPDLVLHRWRRVFAGGYLAHFQRGVMVSQFFSLDQLELIIEFVPQWLLDSFGRVLRLLNLYKLLRRGVIVSKIVLVDQLRLIIEFDRHWVLLIVGFVPHLCNGQLIAIGCLRGINSVTLHIRANMIEIWYLPAVTWWNHNISMSLSD